MRAADQACHVLGRAPPHGHLRDGGRAAATAAGTGREDEAPYGLAGRAVAALGRGGRVVCVCVGTGCESIGV